MLVNCSFLGESFAENSVSSASLVGCDGKHDDDDVDVTGESNTHRREQKFVAEIMWRRRFEFEIIS